MLCGSCGDGYLCEPTPKPLILSYRGFEKKIGTQVYLSCSNCLHEATEPLESTIYIDSEMRLLKIEINRRLSVGDIVL